MCAWYVCQYAFPVKIDARKECFFGLNLWLFIVLGTVREGGKRSSCC